MNKFKYYFILLIATFSLFSCSKNDSDSVIQIKDYNEQYKIDNENIIQYLKTYSITVTDNPGATDDQDVTFTKITDAATQTSIWDQTTYELKNRIVNLHGLDYTLYYLVLREGTGESPTNVDGVLAAYRGDYLKSETVSDVNAVTATKFEEVKFPEQILSLLTTIKGWSESFPEFRTGTNTRDDTNGTVVHTDFGAGVIFIPSGLGYYGSGTSTIPAYAPLVFSFKLFAISRLDSDGDGIMNFQEDLNGDGYMYSYTNTTNYPTFPDDDDIRYADDTDKDGIPDFLDTDDDADGVSTKTEITDNGVLIPFADIPSCDGNTTNPARVKRHLVKCN